MGHKDRIQVLLVEDSDADAFLFARQVKSAGEGLFQVHRIARVEAPLPNVQIDVVVLDFQLPGRSGLSALTYLAGLLSNVPIIGRTGDSNLVLAAEAIRLGAEDVLLKDDAGAERTVRALVFAMERATRRGRHRDGHSDQGRRQAASTSSLDQ